MRLLKFFCILMLIFSASNLFSQDTTISTRKFYFCSGKIGNSKIYLYLYINNNDNISGKYYYDTINQFINIEGSISNNTVYIKEKVNNRITGYFEGSVTEDLIFSGEWTSFDGNNKYDFEFSNDLTYPINKLDIINSILKADSEAGNATFESSKDAVIIINDNNLNAIDKISLDVDGIKSLNSNRIEFILNNDILVEYNDWKQSSNNDSDFYMRKEINVSFIDNKIISFSLYNYSYIGGMHGIYNSIPLIYSIESGDRIGVNLSELIINKNDRELINLMRSKLLRNFTEKDFFDFYSIELSDIFDITPTGIKFIWPVYKISGYAQGVIEIDFTYSELKPFIKKDSKFMYLFNM
ncbi:hypothetical protein R4K48_05415 [Brachyspira pulli]|uniref:DUF3298 domain-containing protein n=1 Tax=Brachyspira pulli TaxID=310721 RepID=UPI0030073828